MNANAPEKIYMTPCFGAPNNVLLASFSKSHLNFHRDIEYTRTDAFIDKACEYWYQYNRNMVKKHGARAVLGCSEFTVNVEGFKKYMEGELNAEKIEIDLLNGVALTEDMLASLAKKVF